MEQHVSGQSNKPLPRPPHALPAEEVARHLDVNLQTGLSADDAARRRNELGANELLKEKNAQPLKILVRQVVNAMTLVSRLRPQRVCPRRQAPLLPAPSSHALT